MRATGTTLEREPIATILALPETERCCSHFWVIETPDGPTSKGVCKNCGEGRAFSNSIPFKPINRR